MSRFPTPDPKAGGFPGRLAQGHRARGMGRQPFSASALMAAVAGMIVAGALLAGLQSERPALGREVVSGNAEPGRLLALSAGASGTSAQKKAKRIKVRAACLYNFIKYASFPKSAFKKHKGKKDPIVILIVGKDPFGKVIDDMLKKKKAHGRSFLIKRSRTVPVRIDAHLIYASGLKPKDEALLVKRSMGQPCLLVGDDKAFPKGGGLIRLYEEKGKTRFDIDLARQKDTKIKLDVELLKLAKVVKGKK